MTDKAIIHWLDKMFPYKVIGGGDCYASRGPLMQRWYVSPRRTSPKSTALMVHCFFRSDLDRAVHDHPWSFLTFPLRGYKEHLPDGTVHYRKPFRFYFRPAEWQHWVEVTGSHTWTIILKFRTRRMWGFLTKDGWIEWLKLNYEADCE